MSRLVILSIVLSKMFLGLVLLAIPSGCQVVQLVSVAMPIIPIPLPGKKEPTHNYYEPEILFSSQYMIRIKYLGTGPHTRHEQVKQMMSDHCDGSYVETYREHEIGYTTVEAECIDGDF